MVNVKPKRFRRRRYNRSSKTKKVNTKKGVTRLVKKVLHSQIENKRNYNVGNFDITPQMDVINCFQVLPTMFQGSKQGQRIGNKIKPMSLRLGVTMTMLAEPYAIDANQMGRSGVYFDLYIFKVIQKPSYDQPVVGSDLDFFLQAGDAFNRYVGNPFNWHQTINKERFIILHRSRRLMNSNGYRRGDTGLIADSWGQNTNSSYSTTISLSKKLKTALKYQDSSQNATNQAIYACVVATRGDNILFPDLQFPAGQVSFYSELVYEDA